LQKEVTHVSTELFSIHELGEHLLEHLKALNGHLKKGKITEEEIQEITEHTKQLDREVHQVIVQLDRMQEEIPKRFDEIFREVEGLKGREEHRKLVEQAQAFRKHLESLS